MILNALEQLIGAEGGDFALIGGAEVSAGLIQPFKIALEFLGVRTRVQIVEIPFGKRPQSKFPFLFFHFGFQIQRELQV